MAFIRGITIFSAIFVGGALYQFRSPEKYERIVGGDTIDISQAPYQLQIQDNGRFICGASLFKPNYAISAAHCFEGLTADEVTVRAGTSYQGDDGAVVSVSRLIIHPSFDLQESYDYDVAILQLSDSFEIGPNIQTIDLYTSDPAEGTPGIATGWGLLYENGPTSYELQSVTIPVQNREICANNYASIINFPISERMFCAGIEGKDACEGDSGGPFVISGRLAGITSFGSGCARANFPGVFANVAQFSSWILENTQ